MSLVSAAHISPSSARRTARVQALLSVVAICTALGGTAWAGRVSVVAGPPTQKNWDCDRCNVQALFMRRMRECSVSMEMIDLKNGVGILYSTDDPRYVPRVQKNAEWARDELKRISLDPDHVHLCSYCKASRAVFSKVDREVVRTAQGALFLMRSEDPEAVRALREMVAKARAKEASPAPSR